MKNIKIDYLTISLDSIDAKTFSSIRGRITEDEFGDLLYMLDDMLKKVQDYGCINKVILQCIKLQKNKEKRGDIFELSKKYENCIYAEKQYINFPGQYEKNVGEKNIFNSNEKIFFYNLIGEKMLFKCLKVWNKKESAVNTDGKMLPCCMMFNDTVNIGDLKNDSLSNILNSEKYKEFREKIWDGQN